jgi:hypothetical protein
MNATFHDQPLEMQLEQSFEELIILISSLSATQVNTVPFPGSWTVAQVGDHLRKSYGAIETLNGTTIPTDREVLEKKEMIKSIFLDFDTKFQSPDFIIPSSAPLNKNELLSRLRIITSEIVAFAKNRDLSLTCTDFELPGMGTLTRSEWLHFIVYHTQRHLHQLRNIISQLRLQKQIA